MPKNNRGKVDRDHGLKITDIWSTNYYGVLSKLNSMAMEEHREALIWNEFWLKLYHQKKQPNENHQGVRFDHRELAADNMENLG